MTSPSILSATASRRRALTALVVLTLATLGATARAQGDKAAAETLFAEGRRLMADGQYAAACPKLAESQRLDPGGGTLLNLALCHDKQGKTATAWSEYKEALAVARADGRSDRIDFAQEHIAAIEPKLSHLVVEVAEPVDGLTVQLDDAELGRASWGIPLPVDPGPHDIRATAEGHAPWSTVVTIDGGARREGVTVPVLVPRPEPTATVPEASPGTPQVSSKSPDDGPNVQRAVGFSIGGLGILGAAIGTGFGVSAVTKDGEADAVCSEDTCPATKAGDEALAQSQSARRDATLANAFIGVGAGLAAVGLVVVLTASDDAPNSEGATTATLTPWLAPQRAGAGLELSW